MNKNKAPLQPAPGYVLLEPIEKKKETLVYKGEEENRPKRGKVLATGGKVITDFDAIIMSPCDVGDEVFHSTIGYEEVEIDYKKYRLVKFQNIIAIIN